MTSLNLNILQEASRGHDKVRGSQSHLHTSEFPTPSFNVVRLSALALAELETKVISSSASG